MVTIWKQAKSDMLLSAMSKESNQCSTRKRNFLKGLLYYIFHWDESWPLALGVGSYGTEQPTTLNKL